MASHENTMGRTGFVDRHNLWTDKDAEAADWVISQIENHDLEVVRLSYPDQHGILRGKTLIARETPQAMRNGCSITTTLLAKDT